MPPPTRRVTLTHRQYAVLVAVTDCDGDRHRAAAVLGVSVRTVDAHLRDIRDRLDLPDRAPFVAILRCVGWVHVPAA